MKVNFMNFLKRFIEGMASEFAIYDLAKENPVEVKRAKQQIQEYGYPRIESEEDYIFWDEFSKRFGLEPPKWTPRQYLKTQ